MKDKRDIYLVLQNGKPKYHCFGLVEYYKDIPEKYKKNGSDWASALGPNQTAENGWEAVKTNYRRVPKELKGKYDSNLVEYDSDNKKIRHLDSGQEWDIRDSGKPDPEGVREPDAPKSKVFDQAKHDAWVAEKQAAAQARKDAINRKKTLTQKLKDGTITQAEKDELLLLLAE